jgi:Uma2 family endonuclease
MTTKRRATIADLYREDGKAEIVNGEIVRMAPTEVWPGRASSAIYFSLRAYERRTKSGTAVPDNVGFVVHLPNRDSFSPDAAFYTGVVVGLKFADGAPVFAAEVRSEGDYGPAMEREMAEKRADYFAAGTLVVWDVDLLHEPVVRVYRANEPDGPTVYHRGELTEAEPAVPGWRMPVDEMFE